MAKVSIRFRMNSGSDFGAPLEPHLVLSLDAVALGRTQGFHLPY
jgi:hypothetical protein